MHRSGTSMVARLLRMCGLDLGQESDLIPSGRDNEEGFWEHKHFVQLNDDLLAALGGGWDFPPPVTPGWEYRPEADPFVVRAQNLLREFDGCEPWGWKDPRTCLTLPLWLRLLPNLPVILCVRHPGEVVRSLTQRSRSSAAFGWNLWETYNRRLIDTISPDRVLVTHYDAYFHDPTSELRRITTWLELPADDEMIRAASASVSLRRRHNRARHLRQRLVPNDVQRTHDELCLRAGPVWTAQSAELGVGDARPPRPHTAGGVPSLLPADLPILPVSHWPTTLPSETVEIARLLPTLIPAAPAGSAAEGSPAGDTPSDHLLLPSVSIIVLTFNNIVFTKLCLTTVLENTDYPRYEIVVVDNASTDGTVDYLRALAASHPQVRLVLNDHNVGFAGGNNRGLHAATGDVVVLLNNDTLVPPGWLARLVRHLESPDVGLVGPTTNSSDNEAEIDIPYSTYGQFLSFSQERASDLDGAESDLPMLVMFCLGMRRDAHDRIGALDERFEIGMFEDDDYALRARALGYRIVCAEDIFVHHFGHASVGRIADDGGYGEIFRANRERFERKWGISWESHRLRRNPEYERMVERVRDTVERYLPPDATLLMVGKGDDDLLALGHRTAHQFPQDGDGEFAGYYPPDGQSAAIHLQELVAQGQEYYRELSAYLESRAHVVVDLDDTCRIYRLESGDPSAWPRGEQPPAASHPSPHDKVAKETHAR
jgi:GT2 family glycosyltransferase